MVDTLSSVCEETALKSDLNSAITIDESAVGQASVEEAKVDSKQGAELPLPYPCIPQIVIMDNFGDSFSPCDSLNSKDTSSSTKNKRRSKKSRRKDQDIRASVLAEGQRGDVAGPEAAAISLEQSLLESGWTQLSLAKARKAHKKHTAMERADISPAYTSDEWEADSAESDTDDDHTDSSDDDDPKSQVDRLIERGALMYMEGENSALSSEGESDDSYEYDSESDITDVSPLVSATASPLGLSPVLPRRTIPTSPLALHDNRDLNFCYDPSQNPFNWDNHTPPFSSPDHVYESSNDNHHNSTNMDLLLQAVIELENKNNSEKYNNLNHNSKTSGLPTHHSDQVFIHPIRDNPHHHHLRKNYQRRKNMSFSNEELLLKKIQEVKPTKPVADSRVPSIGGIEPLLTTVGVSNSSLRTPNSSCGAFMRSISKPPHVSVPPPRKETAL